MLYNFDKDMKEFMLRPWRDLGVSEQIAFMVVTDLFGSGSGIYAA